MTFGQIIKKLRRDADMTQERLAELLSISPQAVSRWETDAAMPDISLLPPLANLFDVTTDYLLGVDISKKQERINEICRAANIKSCEGDEGWAEAIEMIRSAQKLYPDNRELKWWLMHYLAFNRADDREKANACRREMLEICEEMIANEPNEIRRRQAMTHIIRNGRVAGNLPRAMELLHQAPSLQDTHENLATYVYEGEELRHARKYLIMRCIQIIYHNLYSLACQENGYAPEEKKHLLEKGRRLYELLYDEDDYSSMLDPWVTSLELAQMLAEQCGDIDGAYEVLQKELARKYALCQRKCTHISPMLPTKEGRVRMFLEMTTEDWQAELTELVDKDDLYYLEHFMPDDFKADPRYAQIRMDLIAFREKYSPT